MRTGRATRAACAAGALAVLAPLALAACGKDTSGGTTVPGPAATDQPSKGSAPAPGFASGTTAPPVRSPATTRTTATSGSSGSSGTTATTEP
jgi:hypothetical protein